MSGYFRLSIPSPQTGLGCQCGSPESRLITVLSGQVRNMIDLAYQYLREGHLSIIWRDEHYSYGHFLWFEDAMVRIAGCIIGWWASFVLSLPMIALSFCYRRNIFGHVTSL